MTLTPVDEALTRILASAAAPVEPEMVPLAAAGARTLAADLDALRTQPPFAASAMDGYAFAFAGVGPLPAILKVVGASAAGRRYRGTVGPGEAVRIFTGAPLPEGTDSVVIEENVAAGDGVVTLREGVAHGRHVRALGLDFRQGDALLSAGMRLDARRLALAAAMGHARLPVRRRPRVAILATGDELVRPGQAPGEDQIVASNAYAVAALVEGAGGEPLDLGIAADDFAALAEAIGQARSLGADVLVTLGGASIGEHDLVQAALGRAGMRLDFWRIAMRPGKPLMHGRLDGLNVLGLPGNPVSAIVCAILFVVPLVRALLGDPQAGRDISVDGVLAIDLPANDHRQDYLRARLEGSARGLPVARPLPAQDSSLLSVLAEAQALVVRPPLAPRASAGDPCRFIPLHGS
jgi:molybdopterin molybdotransferase